MDSHGAASPGTCVGVMEGVQLVGNVASGSWEVPQILPPFPPTTFLLLTPSKPNHRHTKGHETGNCSGK